MIPAVSFIGHHNSGKTTLLSRLIPCLVGRGLRVGAVKHAPGLSIPAAGGTDSDRLAAAGAEPVVLLAHSGAIATWRHPRHETSSGWWERVCSDCDLVLVEGMKRGPLTKIEVYRHIDGQSQPPLSNEIEVAAVITDDPAAIREKTIRLSPTDIESIADLVESILFPSPIAPPAGL